MTTNKTNGTCGQAVLVALLAAVWACFPQRVFSQQDLSPELAAELAKAPKPPDSNEVVGIDIDRFVGSPFQSPVRVLDDVILARSILTHGDPYHPGDPGAVLENRKDLSMGTVLGHNRTSLASSLDQQFWYIESGNGRLDNGEQYWDLREGIGLLIPPHVKHRLVNSSDEPLQMIMLTWATPPPLTYQSGQKYPDMAGYRAAY